MKVDNTLFPSIGGVPTAGWVLSNPPATLCVALRAGRNPTTGRNGLSNSSESFIKAIMFFLRVIPVPARLARARPEKTGIHLLFLK